MQTNTDADPLLGALTGKVELNYRKEEIAMRVLCALMEGFGNESKHATLLMCRKEALEAFLRDQVADFVGQYASKPQLAVVLTSLFEHGTLDLPLDVMDNTGFATPRSQTMAIACVKEWTGCVSLCIHYIFMICSVDSAFASRELLQRVHLNFKGEIIVTANLRNITKEYINLTLAEASMIREFEVQKHRDARSVLLHDRTMTMRNRFLVGDDTITAQKLAEVKYVLATLSTTMHFVPVAASVFNMSETLSSTREYSELRDHLRRQEMRRAFNRGLGCDVAQGANPPPVDAGGVSVGLDAPQTPDAGNSF